MLRLKQLVQRLRLQGLARLLLVQMLIVLRWLVKAGMLTYAKLPHGLLVQMGHAALARGKESLALEVYHAALRQQPEHLALLLQLGVATYLAGYPPDAEQWFASCEQSGHRILSRLGMSHVPFRMLDRSWTLALGHVAFLGIHAKAVKLGWFTEKTALLACDPATPPIGWPLLRLFSEHQHLRLAIGRSPDDAIDRIVHGAGYRQLDRGVRDEVRAAISQPFWYGPDETGNTRWFAPHAVAVEAAWRSAGHGPLLSLNADDRLRFRRRMWNDHGLPIDAWYVVLHVREPGYYASWHKHHPATRNADIRTYRSVIDSVLSRGGWVVRGGDPTMRPIEPRDGVIDYATGERRSPEIDILLCAECAYFIGTNSGYSLVPPLFGKRCVLTNWSPIAGPNWHGEDIFIPKLVRRREDRSLLTFAELLASPVGWSQFQRDVDRLGLIMEDNSPDDLLLAVDELHQEIFAPSGVAAPADQARLQRFNNLLMAHGAIIGSRMSYRFLEKYAHLLE